MACYLYATLAGENKLTIFEMDPETADLRDRREVRLSGGPGPIGVDPAQRFMYVGVRSTRELASFEIDHASGALRPLNSVDLDADPCYMATDRRGRYLLSAYYAAGKVTVHGIESDGSLRPEAVQDLPTAEKAHCIQTDASNRFVFVPHVMPANAIFQFRFDESTGKLSPNDPPKATPPEGAGPRHFCFHPKASFVYADNEQASSVTSYRFDEDNGALEARQTVSTLPEGFIGQNSNAQLHISPDGRFLYASNRGHNSIAGFALDASGRIRSIGRFPAPPIPRAFNLDPEGRHLFAAGLDSGEMATYRIDGETGALEHLRTTTLGDQPMWILVLNLKG